MSALVLASTLMNNCSEPLPTKSDRRPTLIPIPFAAWHALAWLAEMLPSPPLTRNQVELMQVDNVSSPETPGFADLGISPHSVEEILQQILSRR